MIVLLMRLGSHDLILLVAIRCVVPIILTKELAECVFLLLSLLGHLVDLHLAGRAHLDHCLLFTIPEVIVIIV